jgi:dipeptidyl aminopeptidase/acylaminoacyl peptidase
MKDLSKYPLLIILLTCSMSVIRAQKKTLDHQDFDRWHTIQGNEISPDGEFILYSLQKGEKDHYLRMHDNDGKVLLAYDRGLGGTFTHDSKHALFTIKVWQDSLKELKRKKVKEKELPKDSLAIFDLTQGTLVKIPRVKSYKVPERWSGIIAYQLEEALAIEPDTTINKDSLEADVILEKKGKPSRSVSKDNGYHLVINHLSDGKTDTLKYVSKYAFSKEGKQLIAATTGQDTTEFAQVLRYDYETNQLDTLFSGYKAKIDQLSISDKGDHVGFVIDQDTTKVLVRPYELYHWNTGSARAAKILDRQMLEEGKMVSNNGRIHFSEDETRMFFGIADLPILQDTTLLVEEIVNVEVWTYDEARLYTVQEAQVKADREKSYEAIYHLANKTVMPLASNEFPNIELGNEGNAKFALLNTSEPHELESQWDGLWASDYALIDIHTGTTTSILKHVSGPVSMSPTGAYVYGYNRMDSAWFVYRIADSKLTKLTLGRVFYNELNDAPNASYPYGAAGWTAGDEAIVLYDRYDIWEFDPNTGANKNLTNGRQDHKRYRYYTLDPDERNLPKKGKWLLATFEEKSKKAGYYELNYQNGKGKQLVEGDYLYSRPIKSLNADKVLFTRQSFKEFPDIRYADLNFKSSIKISDANPFQKEYRWGTSELVKWTSLDGIELEGILIKPDDFDPNKKYPMIVNFYEKSADRLNSHWTPSPGRSTINYSFYTSRGYVIFNPNVHYRIGYPGESAYNCVIPGVTNLIEKGFIDKDNIGVQGHSWGGYQIAHLVTKTDIFKAAEAGAPVPNMISAYGGIRWETGLSRQFQYEHTQSRIGGTPWQYPQRYLENSPIYFLDKVNTPLLVMHNDADGHVPWYQGIELFVSLRRLGKPSWLLNYNGEPHWPLKRQNRVDFNIRLAQFFDHYLMGKPKPVWMVKGVPAIEKGINQGYEYEE